MINLIEASESIALKRKKIKRFCRKCQVKFFVDYPGDERYYCVECREKQIFAGPGKFKASCNRRCIKCEKSFVVKDYWITRIWCDKCFVKFSSQKIRVKLDFLKEDFKYTPTNEQEVVVLFFKIMKRLGFTQIVKIQQRFPDAIVIDKSGKQKTIEFEYFSSNYKRHLPEKSDLIVCWINNKSFKDIEIIELSSLFKIQKQ